MSHATEPLTDEEVAELDTFGPLSMFRPLPERAHELWTREILYGRVTPPTNGFEGLITLPGASPVGQVIDGIRKCTWRALNSKTPAGD